MTVKPGLRDFFWMLAGAALLAVIVLLAMRFDGRRSAAEQYALQVEKIELVDAMRVALESAAEAEKSAVLAITDEDSQTYADQARAASGTVEQRRLALAQLLHDRGSGDENERLAAFGKIFADFQRVDDQILALAVKNTNLKASALAYGPAAEALKNMEAAISRLLTALAKSPDLPRVTALALGAEVAALHVQALLSPHIAEETDEKMALLEAEMAREEQVVRENLDAVASGGASPDVEAIGSAWRRYLEIKAEILALSHENTNVLSLALSLNRKRQVTAACRHALAELRDAIEAEPSGVTHFAPAMPR